MGYDHFDSFIGNNSTRLPILSIEQELENKPDMVKRIVYLIVNELPIEETVLPENCDMVSMIQVSLQLLAGKNELKPNSGALNRFRIVNDLIRPQNRSLEELRKDPQWILGSLKKVLHQSDYSVVEFTDRPS